MAQDELASYYRDAFVGLITPLRDGMNLVAKEFVACQSDDDPGVLILSPFAGAGGLMQEALQVRRKGRRTNFFAIGSPFITFREENEESLFA